MKEKLYKLMNWPEIEAVIYSEEDNPHKLLGPHTVGSSTLLATFQPGASQVTAVIGETGKEVKMEIADEAGYFAALIPGKGVTDYVYRVEYPEGKTEEIIDPYRFGPVITKKDTDLFAAGTHYEAYKILGAHSCCIDGVKGVHFAVWAQIGRASCRERVSMFV